MPQDWMVSWGLLFFIIGVIRVLIKLIGRGSSKSKKGGPGESGSGGGSGEGSSGGPGGDASGGKGETNPDAKPSGLDNEHPGRIRILVTNADDSPIPKAEVVIYALDMPAWRRLFKRHTSELMLFRRYTGSDGLCPSRTGYLSLGSGPIKIKIKSRLGNTTTEELVRPYDGEVQLIHVAVPRRGEKSESFEPVIRNVSFDDNQLYLEGVIQ